MMPANITKRVGLEAEGGTQADTQPAQNPNERYCVVCRGKEQPDKPLMAFAEWYPGLYCSEQCAVWAMDNLEFSFGSKLHVSTDRPPHSLTA